MLMVKKYTQRNRYNALWRQSHYHVNKAARNLAMYRKVNNGVDHQIGKTKLLHNDNG